MWRKFLNKEFYDNIIRKILGFKLNLIVLEIDKPNRYYDYFSFDELKEIYPELKPNINRKIFILKNHIYLRNYIYQNLNHLIQ